MERETPAQVLERTIRELYGVAADADIDTLTEPLRSYVTYSLGTVDRGRWTLDELRPFGLKPGFRFFDAGCAYGGFLAAATEAGARENIRVGVQYLAAWLDGKGAVPLYNLMEDAATAEICRSQLWQWLHFEAPLSDGRKFTRDLFDQLFDEEVGILAEVPKIRDAADHFHDMVTADEFEEFLTLPAYELLA